MRFTKRSYRTKYPKKVLILEILNSRLEISDRARQFQDFVKTLQELIHSCFVILQLILQISLGYQNASVQRGEFLLKTVLEFLRAPLHFSVPIKD